ncbi:hypothetical protein ANCDUO_25262 [Ancylostoma duodenale]|uniref:Uncharacterized protein n=1 Tax=Ancylostoma duodenale TaxID=51022 RepID=A0A0C2F889_9BILA|nr:hypothetical protein ANCDUO_25262 [Ancylostoma duodenale]
MLGRVLDSSKNYQTNDYEEAILCPIMGLLLFSFFACLFFIIFIFNYHKFLRLRYGHQVPRLSKTTPANIFIIEISTNLWFSNITNAGIKVNTLGEKRQVKRKNMGKTDCTL